MKQKLTRVKSTDKALYDKIMDDLRHLQAGPIDKNSFDCLYRLLKKKWDSQ